MGKKQSRYDRMDESIGMKDSNMYSKNSEGGVFNVPDNESSYAVHQMSSDAEKFDMSRIRKIPSQSRGYPSQAWNYKY